VKNVEGSKESMEKAESKRGGNSTQTATTLPYISERPQSNPSVSAKNKESDLSEFQLKEGERENEVE